MKWSLDFIFLSLKSFLSWNMIWLFQYFFHPCDAASALSPSLQSADLVRARGALRGAGWLTGCWASGGEGGEVRGHGPEGLRQKADHSRGLIMKPCCWSPAGIPARAKRSAAPVSETWGNTGEWELFYVSYRWVKSFCGDQLTVCGRLRTFFPLQTLL